MFGCEEGGGHGRNVERTKITTSGSHLDAREVVIMADVLKQVQKPPLAHVWM